MSDGESPNLNDRWKELEPYRYNPEYDSNDVRADQKYGCVVECSWSKQKRQEKTASSVMESIFCELVKTGNWFNERNKYSEDAEWKQPFSIQHTSIIDDYFNHIDFVATVANPDTNNEVIPFAIDITCNTNYNLNGDSPTIVKKFEYKHLHGKTDDISSEESEFGAIITDEHGKILKTQARPERQRNGLKIPGFAAAKYFYDPESSYPGATQGCKINVMPRFVIGFDPRYTTDILSTKLPNEDASYYNKRKKEHDEAEAHAKWCMLTQLTEQSTAIRNYLENLSEEDTKNMDQDELRTAKEQIYLLEKYFQSSLKASKVKARNGDKIESYGEDSLSKDATCQTIRIQTDLAYK